MGAGRLPGGCRVNHVIVERSFDFTICMCLFGLKLHYKNNDIAKRDFNFTICICLFGLKLHCENMKIVKLDFLKREQLFFFREDIQLYDFHVFVMEL